MDQVDISIIIATRNRKEILCQTVRKAMAAIEKRAVEIVVVNDGDEPLVLPGNILKGIHYFDNPKQGVSSARNFGAMNAQGHILFFLDDDMWINEEVIDWIRHHLPGYAATPAVYNINWVYPDYLNQKLLQSKIGRYILAGGYNTLWGRMHEKGTEPLKGLYPFHTIGSGSLVIEMKVFLSIGMYNESILFQGEDIDLSSRINKAGIPIFCVFDTVLYHNQEDRLDLMEYIERVSNGYRSQFMAEQAGLLPSSIQGLKPLQIFIFESFRRTEKLWMVLFNALPNSSALNRFTNRLIGMLSGLQKYKQWQNTGMKSKH